MSKFKSTLKLLFPALASFLVAGIASSGSYVEMAGSLAGVVFMVPLFVEFFKVTLKLKGKTIFNIKSPRFASWAISIALVYISSMAGWGFFGELDGFIKIGLTGFGVGLAANGYFTIEMIQELLLALFSQLRGGTDVPKPEGDITKE